MEKEKEKDNRRSEALKRYWASLTPEAKAQRVTILSEEARAKISASASLRKHDEATRKKISSSLTGKHPSPETRAKLSRSSKGRVHSPETKALLSKINKNRVVSPETRRKISEAMKGRKLSESHRAAVSRGLMGTSKLLGSPHISKAERKLKAELERRGIEVTQQKRVGRFRADLFLPTLNLLVECDGIYWHSLPGRKERDRARDEFFFRRGFLVAHVDEPKIHKDVKLVVDTLLRFADKYQAQE